MSYYVFMIKEKPGISCIHDINSYVLFRLKVNDSCQVLKNSDSNVKQNFILHFCSDISYFTENFI